MGRRAGSNHDDHLTRREGMVLELVCCGLGNVAIAAALCVETRTIRTYIEHLRAKLDAPNRTTLAVLALARGLVTLDRVRALWGVYMPGVEQ
jgi:DNA-binding NarL/FixJ family response regulator